MKKLIAVIAMLFVLGPAVSQAQQCRLLAMADELQLTDQQIEQLKSNMIAQKKEMIQLRANLEKAKLELNELMLAKQIDKQAALKKSETMSAIKADMAKKRLAARIDRLNMLDNNQRAKLRKKMMFHGPGMGKRPGHGKDHRDGPIKKHKKGHGMGDGKNIDITIEKEIIGNDE